MFIPDYRVQLQLNCQNNYVSKFCNRPGYSWILIKNVYINMFTAHVKLEDFALKNFFLKTAAIVGLKPLSE